MFMRFAVGVGLAHVRKSPALQTGPNRTVTDLLLVDLAHVLSGLLAVVKDLSGDVRHDLENRGLLWVALNPHSAS
jgi:hypothetical protein